MKMVRLLKSLLFRSPSLVIGILFSFTWPIPLMLGLYTEIFTRTVKAYPTRVEFFLAAVIGFLLFYVLASFTFVALNLCYRLESRFVKKFMKLGVLLTFSAFQVVCWSSLHYFGSFPSILSIAALATTDSSWLGLCMTTADVIMLAIIVGTTSIVSICMAVAFTKKIQVQTSQLALGSANVIALGLVCVIFSTLNSDQAARVSYILKVAISPEFAVTSDAIKFLFTGKKIESASFKPVQPLELWKKRALQTNHTEMDVFIVVIEALRKSALEVHSQPQLIVPNLARLSLLSTNYSVAYAASSETGYSLEAITSGRYPFHGNIRHSVSKAEAQVQVPIFDLLQPLGFRTAVFSSSDWSGNARLFDRPSIEVYQDAFRQRNKSSVNDAGQRGLMDLGLDVDIFRPFDSDNNGTTFASLDVRTTNEFRSWIANAGLDKPLCALVYLGSSHFPWLVDDEQHKIFPNLEMGKSEWLSALGSIDPGDSAWLQKHYQNGLHQVDYFFGQILDAIHSKKSTRPLLLIVVGDHGEALGQHGMVAHGSNLHEEQVRVPLLVYDSRVRLNRTDPRPVVHVDIAPSIIDIVGLPVYNGFQGVSFKTDSPQSERDIFLTLQAFSTEDAVVTWPYKLISGTSGSPLLFNLQDDPFEETNLSKSLPGISSIMAEKLEFFRSVQRAYYSIPVTTRASLAPPRGRAEVDEMRR